MKINKDKLIIFLLPVVGLFLVYIFFFLDKDLATPKKNDGEDITLVKGDIVETTQTKVEQYENAYNESRKQKRKIQDDMDFFSDITKEEPQSITDVVERKSVAPEEVENPKVVVKYVERKRKKIYTADKTEDDIKKEAPTVAIPKIEEPVKRRRTGFATEAGSTGKIVAGPIKIETAVLNDVTVRSGNLINLRTTEACTVKGVVVPENTVLSGKVNFTETKMDIVVSSIVVDNQQIAIALNGYDINGGDIAIEGGVNKQIKGEVAGDVLDETSRRINVPLLGSIPNFTKRKVQDYSVPMPKGFKIILRE